MTWFFLKSASTVCSSKGQALQLTYGLDFLSIQAYRLWMEHPSRGKVKLKSNAMQTLSIFGNAGVFIGKATLNDVGKHSFRATVVDNGEPGGNDQFGLQVTAPSGAIIPSLTFDPITLSGGNIQVPHQSGNQATSSKTALKWKAVR